MPGAFQLAGGMARMGDIHDVGALEKAQQGQVGLSVGAGDFVRSVRGGNDNPPVLKKANIPIPKLQHVRLDIAKLERDQAAFLGADLGFSNEAGSGAAAGRAMGVQDIIFYSLTPTAIFLQVHATH